MKYKIIGVFLTTFLCFEVYKIAYKRELLILALGDSSCRASSIYGVKRKSYNNYLSDYLNADLNDSLCQDNLKVFDLYSAIIGNKNQILEKLDKADYITVMVGYDELTSYKQVSNIIRRDFLDIYNKTLQEITKNTKAKVLVLGYYPNYFSNTKEINQKLEIIVKNNNAIFIDTSNIIEDSNYFYDSKLYHLNEAGNKTIFNYIKEKL